tara:strand:- start:861 stop:1130 length:270 start_codon:yes stop_codon:yes gene_type:complete
MVYGYPHGWFPVSIEYLGKRYEAVVRRGKNEKIIVDTANIKELRPFVWKGRPSPSPFGPRIKRYQAKLSDTARMTIVQKAILRAEELIG